MRTDRNWIQTFTGRQFWPTDPRADDIDIRDIAHALSMKCRYTGHCREFYSVGQHSILASDIVPPEHALWGLMHDAGEAYLPDVARPVKRELHGFREIEDRILACVAERFSLPWPPPHEEIERADLILLATERRDLMAAPPIPWVSTENVQPFPGVIWPLGPDRAELEFLKRFKILTEVR